MLPDGVSAVDQEGQLSDPADFHDACKRTAQIEEQMMYNTFNMGIGMVVGGGSGGCGCDAVAACKAAGEQAYADRRSWKPEKRAVELC